MHASQTDLRDCTPFVAGQGGPTGGRDASGIVSLRNQSVRTLLLVLLLVAGGVVGYFVWYERAYPAKAEQPITDKIDRAKIQDKITASGKVEYKGWLRNVSVEIDGKIMKGAKELTVGKMVNEGDVLLTLDD